jgi:hypothetical protein
MDLLLQNSFAAIKLSISVKGRCKMIRRKIGRYYNDWTKSKAKYVTSHRNALNSMGLEVEVIECPCLDGFSYEEIREMDC